MIVVERGPSSRLVVERIEHESGPRLRIAWKFKAKSSDRWLSSQRVLSLSHDEAEALRQALSDTLDDEEKTS